jgi:hypothetical protein
MEVTKNKKSIKYFINGFKKFKSSKTGLNILLFYYNYKKINKLSMVLI